MGAVSRKFHRLVLSAANEVVKAAGGKCWLDNGRGGHGKLYIEVGGKKRSTPISSSPRSDENAICMKLADVRRILREMR